MGELYNLTNLEELFLDDTYITRSLLLNMQALSSLKILSLNRCKLSGTLPDLYLSNNELIGVLPPCMRNLTSLLVMDLSSNQLTGNIASSPLVDLISLQYLSFSSNQFQVPASFASFSNHTNLKLISCDHNELIPELNLQTSVPIFQLNFFSMSNCRSKTRTAQFPYFLHFQYDLRVLDMSDNNFGGQFPSWLLQNNTRLQRIYLKNNALEGPLELHYPLSNLSTVDISSNYMHGQSLEAICSNFPNLVNLIIAENGLTGGIPPCFENMTYLAYLDMSNNELSSALFELLPLFGSSLWFLKLSNNNFDGRMSPTFFNQTRFAYLYLDNNNFSGQIPDSISTNVFTSLLDISNNHFSGMLPRWLGNLSSVQAIDFSKNHFHGSIPGEICNLPGLQFFDLSENNLSDSIPSCTNLPKISHVHLYHNLFSGPLTYAFYNSSNLVTLDLRENQLTGTFPKWISSLPKLSVLLLKGNNFNGGLPAELCLLRQLSILDLSQNMFSGQLPSCLSNINFTAIWIKNETLSDKTSLETLEDTSSVSIGGRKLPQQGVDLIQRIMWPVISVEEVIEFTTKRGYYSYKGSILNLIIWKYARPACTKPVTQQSHRSNPPIVLQVEADRELDLSHNGLTGAIPQQLTELHSLAVFSVVYNNLSGKAPEMKGQFGTFDQTSYEGNPLLCGPLLEKKCFQEAQLPSGPGGSIHSQESDGFMDMEGFYISFGLSYTTVVVTIAAVLCINPHWRHAWFYFIEMFITTCNSLLVDSFDKLCQLGSTPNGHALSSWVEDSEDADCCKWRRVTCNATTRRVIQLSLGKTRGSELGELYRPAREWIVLIILLLFLNWTYYGSYACLMEERDALLQIKAWFGPIGAMVCQVGWTRMTMLIVANGAHGPLSYAFFNSSNLVTLDLRENQLTGTVPNWINRLSSLSVLLLKSNNFDGDLPVELCSLAQLSILDLSHYMLSGRLPACLSNINFTAIWIKNETLTDEITWDQTEDSSSVPIGRQKLPQQGMDLIHRLMWPVIIVDEVIEFTTKRGYYSYKGLNLNLMSGVDLSCNRFTGKIPPELGNMRGLRALNLSHNNPTGAIPPSFANLKEIESLDLSHNGPTGAIPQQLTQIHFLA
ncbi:hypothetical protein Tsubulata_027066, partial [Turnera subulata]